MPNRIEGEFTNTQQENAQQLNENFSQHLNELLNIPLITMLFESDLEQLGLISELENLGVLTTVENPNPYNPESDEIHHEQWWEEHKTEMTSFRESIELRENALKYLFIGSILGHFYNLFPYRRSS